MTAAQTASRSTTALWRARRRSLKLVARYAAAIAIVVVFMFPVYWVFIMAFKTPEETFARPPVWIPADFQFDTFRSLFKDGGVGAIWTSLITAGVSTAFAMFFGTICAYSLARFRTGGANLAIGILSQRMIPPIVIVFPVFLAYVFLRWIDTFHGLIILYTAFNLPYVIWMMRGYIEDIPIELEHSALVDGWSRWQVLLRVVFPLARAGLFATAVFTFIFAWNDYIFALILTRTEIVTFPVQLTVWFDPQSVFWAKIGAMSIMGTLPIFFAVLVFQRYMVRGISLGAVKG